MALTQVTGPYPIFTDLDGSPLDDGYLYIGAANQDPETNPIQVYWDSGLTIPATQPIRTNNGYAWRNGTPGLLYTATEFSITIRNKRNEFVLYSPLGYGFDPKSVSASVVKNDFVGNGVQTNFTISAAPSSKLATNIFINGVYQEKDSYTLTGNVISFSIAPPLSSSIEIMTNETGVINGGNANDITYTLTAPGATLQSVQSKLEQYISVKDFGAVGDGVADDTAAVHAAITEAISTNGSVFFPVGKYRVTSGYTNNTNNSVSLFGESIDYFATDATDADGSCVILDSASSGSFFYSQTAGNNLQVSNMQFACAQVVTDRAFFKQSASSVRHIFENVHFASVERPFVYSAGCYFQLSSYTNIRFTNSGSFHSTVTGSGPSSLVGTFMAINNVDVEGSVPAGSISEKIICNLQGIREIQARTFVIEPSTPNTGWTALFMANPYNVDWTRFPMAVFNGLWIEVTGSGLDYAIHQSGGRTKFVSPVFNNGALSPILIDNDGAAEISEASFSDADPLQDYFSLNTYLCQVKLTNCNYRNAGTAINDPQFTFDNCSNSLGGGVPLEPFTATSHNNQQSELLWAFDGGYPDPGKVLVQAFGGTTVVPTVDASFGRGLYINPNAGALDVLFQGRLRSNFPQGGQIFVVAQGTLPNIPTGALEMKFLFNGTNIGGGVVWLPADSLTSFRIALPVTAQAANPTTMGVTFTGNADTAALKLHQLELWVGKSLPSVTMPSFPQNVQTYAAAIPSAGEWARGDIIWNNAPSAGGTPGWVCTTGGTPGTWKAMANLAV